MLAGDMQFIFKKIKLWAGFSDQIKEQKQACLKNSKMDTVILNKTKRQEVQKQIKAASGDFWKKKKKKEADF